MSKLEKFKRAINAGLVFHDNLDCLSCPIGRQCDIATAEGLFDHGDSCSCLNAFLAAVIAGIIDLDGNPIKTKKADQ